MRLPCSRYEDGKLITKATVMVDSSKVVIVDRLELSKNNTRLRIRALDGDYIFNLDGPLSAVEDMLADFGFWRADSPNIININLVDHFATTFYEARAVFKGTGLIGKVAMYKVKTLSKLFPHIPIIKA